jgi:hypothetical protein
MESIKEPILVQQKKSSFARQICANRYALLLSNGKYTFQFDNLSDVSVKNEKKMLQIFNTIKLVSNGSNGTQFCRRC